MEIKKFISNKVIHFASISLISVLVFIIGISSAKAITLWYLDDTTLKPVDSTWGISLSTIQGSLTVGTLTATSTSASSTIHFLNVWQRLGIGRTATTTIRGDNATSTFSNGINITQGCFSLNNSCIAAGITSLGGLTGATQTFANDTNVTMSSAGTEHTLGWTGTLAEARGGTGATSFGNPFYTFFNATTTNALSEGASNLYYTASRDIRHSTTSSDFWMTSTTTLPSLTTLTGLTTIGSAGNYITFNGGLLTSASSTASILTVSALRATTTLNYWFNNSGGITGNSNLVTTGTLTTGATGAGFTVNLDASTLTCTACIDISSHTNLGTSNGLTLIGDTISMLSAPWATTSADFWVTSTTTLPQLKRDITFSYATTTTWIGTTTIYLGVASTKQTWQEARCETDGTLNVVFNDGTNLMNLINASSTIGTVALTTNNTFAISESRRVNIGTPGSSATKIACTVTKINQ